MIGLTTGQGNIWDGGFGFGHLHLSATYQQQFLLFWLGLVALTLGFMMLVLLSWEYR